VSGSAETVFGAAESELAAAGLNLHGRLAVARYDACVPPAWRASALAPAARTAVVVAAGGRALFAAFAAAPEAQRPVDPLDAYTRRVVEAAARRIDAHAVFAWERFGGVTADFVALGRAAGLGAASRLGLLLHPVYGPWMSLRAVLLTPLRLSDTPPPGDFDPCPGCAAPCAEACPGAAPTPDGFDVARCAATRRERPACRDRCDARRACVIGPEHAYAAAAEAHHMRSLGGLDISR
jgi:hypothetical protein